MKKKDRWFWVKLFGPALLALPWLLSFLFDVMNFQTQSKVNNLISLEILFAGAGIQIIWASFFPKTSTSIFAKILLVVGIFLSYLPYFILYNHSGPGGDSGHAITSISITGLSLIFTAFILYIKVGGPERSFQRKVLDIVRHLASILCVWVFLAEDIVYLLYKLDILQSNTQLRIIKEYPSVLLLAFLAISGIGYYISSISDHKNKQRDNMDGLIEKIGG